ncbi:hypothetical protein ACFL3S_05570 [Gemmatimonadota bacterium]
MRELSVLEGTPTDVVFRPLQSSEVSVELGEFKPPESATHVVNLIAVLRPVMKT